MTNVILKLSLELHFATVYKCHVEWQFRTVFGEVFETDEMYKEW